VAVSFIGGGNRTNFIT